MGLLLVGGFLARTFTPGPISAKLGLVLGTQTDAVATCLAIKTICLSSLPDQLINISNLSQLLNPLFTDSLVKADNGGAAQETAAAAWATRFGAARQPLCSTAGVYHRQEQLAGASQQTSNH